MSNAIHDWLQEHPQNTFISNFSMLNVEHGNARVQKLMSSGIHDPDVSLCQMSDDPGHCPGRLIQLNEAQMYNNVYTSCMVHECRRDTTRPPQSQTTATHSADQGLEASDQMLSRYHAIHTNSGDPRSGHSSHSCLDLQPCAHT